MTERMSSTHLRSLMARARAKPVDREGPVHEAVLAYLRAALPGAVIHHSPNETDLSGKQAMRMVDRAKKLGMCTGWPDIEILWRGRFWTLEVKAPGRYPTEAQKECGADIEAQGGRWAVVRSVDDARRAIGAWMAEDPTTSVELRGTIR